MKRFLVALSMLAMLSSQTFAQSAAPGQLLQAGTNMHMKIRGVKGIDSNYADSTVFFLPAATTTAETSAALDFQRFPLDPEGTGSQGFGTINYGGTTPVAAPLTAFSFLELVGSATQPGTCDSLNGYVQFSENGTIWSAAQAISLVGTSAVGYIKGTPAQLQADIDVTTSTANIYMTRFVRFIWFGDTGGKWGGLSVTLKAFVNKLGN